MSATDRGKRVSRLVTRALAGHSVLGLTMAALLYVVTLSGVIAVFHQELQRWEQPGAPEMSRIEPSAVQSAAERVLADGDPQTNHFFVNLPTEALPRTVITTDHRAVFIDESGNIAGQETHPWTQFLLDLHYYLHLPETAGLTLVGMTGVVLLALAISGLLAHPRLFRDAFRLRLGGSRRLSQTDFHNRLGVWTAPFHIAVALSGAILGLISIVALVWADMEHGGDVEAVYAPVFGEEPAPDPAPAPVPNIASALQTMAETHADLTPTHVLLHEPKTDGQHLQILAQHTDRLIFGDYYNFSAKGDYEGNVGMSDGAAGQQLVASAYRLHFGSFGGLPVKLAYGVFGLLLGYIIVTGMTIYTARRRDAARPVPRIESLWSAVAWGTPAALALSLLTTVTLASSTDTLARVFWTFLALAIALGGTGISASKLSTVLRLVTGLSLLAAATSHWLAHWGSFLSPAAFGVTAVLMAIAAIMLGAPAMRPLMRRRRATQTSRRLHQPAE